MGDMQKLREDEESLLKKVPIGAIFRHYEGREYKILQIGRSKKDYPFQVVYQALFHCREFGTYPVWVEPLPPFLEPVDFQGDTISRFTLIHE
jgi:hypothetical protein